MEDRAHIDADYRKAKRDGTLDKRDPVKIAGDDAKYAELEFANTTDADAEYMGGMTRGGSLRKGVGSLKKRLGSLRHRKNSGD
jgi:hypothetical protein